MNISNSYARNKALWLVVAVSLGVHILGLVVFGAFRIIESVIREDQVFEAPPIEEVRQEQPEYTVNLEQRNQSSAPPRPNPITVDSPDVTMPALNIDLNVANTSSYGRGSGRLGSGSGLSDMREMAIADLNFFGAEATGSHIVMILDATWSGARIFNKAREEVFKTIDQMRGTAAQFALIYFGGGIAGHIVGSMDVDPTKTDYRFPSGIPARKWLTADSSETERIIEQLNRVDPGSPESKVRSVSDITKPEQFFVTRTQFWGAINAAFSMQPAPDTVFFMVEPGVAFPNPTRARESYDWFRKYGRRKPAETSVQFIIGRMPTGEVLDGLRYMVNELNGRGLDESEIDKRITTTIE